MAASGARKTWPATTYQLVMALVKEGLNDPQVAGRTGVPRDTVKHWRRGRVPMFEAVTKRPRSSVAERRRKQRDYAIVRYYRRNHKFHPKHNPNPLLAPFEHLWYPIGPVLDLIVASRTSKEVICCFGRQTLMGRRWYDWLKNRDNTNKWVRFDTVDRLLTALDLNSEMWRLGDPAYCPLAGGPNGHSWSPEDAVRARAAAK